MSGYTQGCEKTTMSASQTAALAAFTKSGEWCASNGNDTSITVLPPAS